MMHEARVPRSGQSRAVPRDDGMTEATHSSWLLCRTGAILCALPIEHVVEIMRLLPIEQIAGAPEYIRGLSVIRGAPVPVVDLGRIIGDHVSHATRLITVKAATGTVALAVEAVVGITAIAPDAFAQWPPLLGEVATATIAAIGTLDSELMVFLRTARLVPEDVLVRLSAERGAS